MSTVACIRVPRFELQAAVGERAELLRAPVALAPEPDREQVVGEVSGAAEAHGVHAGMRLGEALARCPGLRLLAADPECAEVAWDSTLSALEGIGAAVESGRPGEAYFEADGLRRLYGGHLEGVLARARRALAIRARVGAAPSRFCAFAAAGTARPGRSAAIVPPGAARAFLAPLSVSLLRSRLPAVAARSDDVPAALHRLGVRTLGELAALDSGEMSDRFGGPGMLAWSLAHGFDEPLRPRPSREQLVERIELPEAVSGLQLERMLSLLIDRLLARAERRGRSFRSLRLGGRFVEQGTWRREVTLRQATASRERLRLVLMPKLAELPAPIEQLSLSALSLGPPTGEQLGLETPDGSERRRRLAEALRQTRAAAGADSVLRVLDVDPTSRVPERRAVLTPFPEPGAHPDGGT